MTKTRLLLALLGALSVWSPAVAQPTGVTSSPQVGVLDRPCAAVEPMPAVLLSYLAAAAKAKAANQPAPETTAEGLAAYEAWVNKRLLQDYAGRCFYDAKNAALPPASDHRVVFIGNSITEGWGAQDPVFFSGETINRGISGQTTAQTIIRFQSDVVALKPRVVHILAGTNDIAGNTGPTSLAWIEDNIETMVTLAKANNIRVVLGSVTPAAILPWRTSIQPLDHIAALNAWLADYAKAEGIDFVDYHSVLADERGGLRKDLSDDGVHPNPAGYALMKPLAEVAIKRALAATPN